MRVFMRAWEFAFFNSVLGTACHESKKKADRPEINFTFVTPEKRPDAAVVYIKIISTRENF